MKPFAATADRRVCGVSPSSKESGQEKLSPGLDSTRHRSLVERRQRRDILFKISVLLIKRKFSSAIIFDKRA